MTQELTVNIAAARDAIARGAWAQAYEQLDAADRQRPLAHGELALLADAAYMTSNIDRAIATWERVHAAALQADDKVAAANAALWVTILLLDATRMAPLRGWQRRLESLLEQLPESAAHAGAKAADSFAALMTGHIDAAIKAADDALDIAVRLRDPTMTALAKNAKARGLIVRGALGEGLELLEDAAVSAQSGEVGAFGSGVLYCSTICACQSIGEYELAEQWTSAMERWTASAVHPRAFHGRCRVHRAQIELRRGAWETAQSEALAGADELHDSSPLDEGWGLAELGAVRLRMGDLDGAQTAFDRAYAAGWEPQPGAALLRLARGDIAGAAASIRAAVDDPIETPSREIPPNTDLRRAPVLEAQVEIAVAAGDMARARWAADQLNSIAAAMEIRSLKASAAVAQGRAFLAEGDADAARRNFQTGARLWQELGAPYETARARMGIAAAAAAQGNEERALVEYRTARQTFARLGARNDARAAAEALGERMSDEAMASQRETKVFVFTDIVGSTNLVEVIGDDAWRHLLRWHDETIGGLVTEHHGKVAANTGDGFMLTFDTSGDAFAAAMAIQRALDRHRREHGFAPQVRIGVHRAAATREGDAWSGAGVHMAARIGALAQGGQILASSETAANVPGLRRSAPEKVALKGFAEPVEVVRIDLAAAGS